MDASGPSGGPRPGVLGSVLADWTVRIGPEAAALRVTYCRLIVAAWTVGLAGLATAMAGSAAHLPPLGPLGVVLLGAGLALYVRAAVELRRMHDRAAKALGVRIRFFQGPPSREELYRRWCEQRHLVPYPFPDAAPAAVRTRWF